MKRGRKRSSWQQLRDRNAKPSVWKRRRLEDEPPSALAPTPAVQAFLKAWTTEQESFKSRFFANEPLLRNLDGSVFDFPAFHYLTQCRDFAQAIVNEPVPGEWSKEISTRFLHDIATGHERGHYIDPLSSDTIVSMYAAYGPGEPIKLLRLLSIVEFLSSKLANGEYRIADRALLDFQEDDLHMMSKSFAAQQEMVKNARS